MFTDVWAVPKEPWRLCTAEGGWLETALEKEKKKNQMDNELIKPRGKWASRLSKLVSFFWRHTFAIIGEDWVFLALLGMITAILSFTIDYGILMCHTGINSYKCRF